MACEWVLDVARYVLMVNVIEAVLDQWIALLLHLPFPLFGREPVSFCNLPLGGRVCDAVNSALGAGPHEEDLEFLAVVLLAMLHDDVVKVLCRMVVDVAQLVCLFVFVFCFGQS